MPDLERQARNCMTGFINTKQAACADARGPYDLQPMLHVEWADGEWELGLLDVREAIPVLLDAMRARRESEGKSTDLAWAAFLGDVVVRWYDLTDAADAAEHATIDMDNARGHVLAKREQGDMRVEDALSLVIVDVKGGCVHAMQRYGYTDAGQPKFHQLELRPDVDGAVRDMLTAAVAGTAPPVTDEPDGRG